MESEVKKQLLLKAANLIMANAEITDTSNEEMAEQIRALWEAAPDLSIKQLQNRVRQLRGNSDASDEELKELRRIAGLGN
jgi:hypothetical protein